MGWPARLLLAEPPPPLKRWTDRTPKPGTLQAYNDLIGKLLDLRPAERECGSDPYALQLTPDALTTWVEWYNCNAQRIADAGTDRDAASLAKIEAYGARFALIFALAENPDATDVSAKAMQQGTTVADWFGHEAQRVHAKMDETDEDRDLRNLADWVVRKGGDVTVRDVTHGNRRYRGQPELARADLRALATAGYGTFGYPPTGPKGGQPSERFEIDPGYGVTIPLAEMGIAVTNTPAEPHENGSSGTGDTPEAAPPPGAPDVDESPGCPDGEAPPADTYPDVDAPCGSEAEDWGEL